MIVLTELAKSKLKRRLSILLLLSFSIAAYCAIDIYLYFTRNTYESFFAWLAYNMLLISLNVAPTQYPTVFPTLSIFFLLCTLSCALYSVIRTRQAEKLLDKYEKEGVGHPVLQLLRVGLFKEAVDYYFNEGRSYECANFLYGSLVRNPLILRYVWKMVSSRLNGVSLLEEAKKLLLVSEDAPQEYRIYVRDMLIENGVYEIGSPEEFEWIERALRSEVEEEKCMVCGDKLPPDSKHFTCPFCFNKACEKHLNDYFKQKDKCPSCKRPLKKYLSDGLTKNGLDT